MDSEPPVSPPSPRVLGSAFVEMTLRSFRMLFVCVALLHRHLQDDIKMMWEPNVVAAQVEPYVTDYGIDTVSE